MVTINFQIRDIPPPVVLWYRLPVLTSSVLHSQRSIKSLFQSRNENKYCIIIFDLKVQTATRREIAVNIFMANVQHTFWDHKQGKLVHQGGTPGKFSYSICWWYAEINCYHCVWFNILEICTVTHWWSIQPL